MWAIGQVGQGGPQITKPKSLIENISHSLAQPLMTQNAYGLHWFPDWLEVAWVQQFRL